MAKESKTCNDDKCPVHGKTKTRGRSFVGVVTSSKAHKTATVSWERRYFIPKFERYEKRRTKLQVHNPPCIDAKEGDTVKIMETRPLSKTKNFTIIEVVEVAGEKPVEQGKEDESSKSENN